MYSKLKSCVRKPEGLTEFFSCNIGTRQGCVISPFLFVLYLEELVDMCKSAGCDGIFISENIDNVGLLLYADDLAFLNDTVGRIQKMLNVLSEFATKFCLKVNLSKSNSIVFRKVVHCAKMKNGFLMERT